MTPGGVPEDLAAEVAESRARQGLPPTVEDAGTLQQVAVLLADAMLQDRPAEGDGDGDQPTTPTRRKAAAS
jgi:hypothetical protein